jgi:NodT family efflux transporter outer membrane factor (OMF) lipoprotein
MLSGCAYYGDMHSNSQPLTAADLSNTHIKPANKMAITTGYWRRFNDPTLNQLINTALQNSPNINIAQARVKRAQHMVQTAASSLFPSVNFNGYVERDRFSKYGLIPPPFNGKTFNIGDLALNFRYDFDFWGKNRNSVAAQVSKACAEQAELSQAQLVISAAVAKTYFELSSSIAQEKMAKENWDVANQILKLITILAKRGIESDIPVTSLQTDVETAKLTYINFQRNEALLRNQLAVLLGENPMNTDIKTKKFVFKKYHVTLPASLPANLLARRPDIYAAKLRAEAAAKQINVAKARFFPDISLYGLFSYQSALGLNHLFEAASQDNGAGVAVDLPIFDANKRRGMLGARYAEYDEAVNTYNQTILTALKEVSDQLSKLKTLNSAIEAEKIAVQSSTQNYKLYLAQYNRGITEYETVLEAKQLLLNKQARQLNLQTRHLVAFVMMQKALGG